MKSKLFLLSLFIVLPTMIFAQRTETNKWYVENYKESNARAYFDANSYYLDPIEGIWQSSDGYKYAIEKDVENSKRQNDKYRVIILESSFDGWKPSEIKGFISLGSIDGVYSMKYYTNSSTGGSLSSQNVILVQENPILMTFQRLDTGDKISMYKLYPKTTTERESGNQSGAYASSSQGKKWSGSSIVIGQRHLATNYHVVEDAKSLYVCGADGLPNSEYVAEVIASDKFNDLAIIKITDNRFRGFSNIRYGSKTNTIDVGTSIFVLGYPLTSTMGDEIKLTTGVISSKSGFQGDISQYQISAAVQPGNSGGPLFDNKGNLVGIVSAKHTGAENVGYAIKLSYLQILLESIDEKVTLPTSNTIGSYSLAEQVKAISPYVLLIKASDSIGSSTNNANQSGYQSGGVGTDKPSSSVIKEAKQYLDNCNTKYKNGDYTGAYSDACKSVELYPTPESHYFRGFLALHIAKNYDQAKESFLYCIDKGHRLEAAYSQLGSVYYNLEMYSEAIEVYGKVININVRDVEALYMRGLCKSKLDDRQGAIADYKQAIKYEGIVESNYATIYNNIAYSYIELNDLESAKPYIKDALKRNQRIGYIWDTDGELSYKLGDYQACIVSMNNSITIDKESENSYYYRGLAKLKLGYLSDAYKDLERARDLGKNEAVEELAKIDVTKIDFSETISYVEVYTSPKVGRNNSSDTKIVGIETTNESTTLFVEYTNYKYDNGWYSIDPNTYIRDKSTGQTYKLLITSNCAISPKKTPLDKGKTAKFALTFPAISKDCKQIDFVESESSSWKFYGIKLE